MKNLSNFQKIALGLGGFFVVGFIVSSLFVSRDALTGGYQFNPFTKKLDIVSTSTTAGSQTPWTSDINADGYELYNASSSQVLFGDITNPSFAIQNGGSNVGIYSPASNVLAIDTGAQNSALFGIGTSTILGTLKVTGSTTIGSTVITPNASTNGQVLKSDGTNAYWVATSTLGFGAGGSQTPWTSAINGGGYALSNASSIKNSNGDIVSNYWVVSTSTNTGNFTDLQSAVNAATAGATIHVRCGTYTLPTGLNGVTIKNNGITIEGEGLCTQLNFDKANTTNAIGWNTYGLTNTTLRDFYIHQTNATFGGIGINASNTPILYVSRIKIDQTATSTSIKDSQNQSFYQHWIDLDLRDNTSCIDIGGLPVNDNEWDNVRCAQHSGNKGFGLYMTSSSANGAQNNSFKHFDAEPTGAATGLTAIYLDKAVDSTFYSSYIEGNAVGYNITANAQRTMFVGGEIVANTSYTNNGAQTQFLNVDKEYVNYNQLSASTSIQDISSNDATLPNLYLYGNTNYARTYPSLVVQLMNASDTGGGVKIINPGTGPSLWVQSGNVGIATATPGSKLEIWGASSGKILSLFSNTGTKFLEMLNTGVTSLLGTWDFGGATSLKLPNGTAPLVGSTGMIAVDTTSDQLKYGGGTATSTLINYQSPSFTYATSTAFSGTTTIPLGVAWEAETWSDVRCFTDTGTLNVQFGDGTNKMVLFNASTTVGNISLTSNNTFTASEKRYVDIGTAASSPTKISCTIKKKVDSN